MTPRDNVCDVTLDLISLKNPEEPGSQEAELSLTGVRESCNHFSHGGLASDAGQAVVIGKQEPVRGKKNVLNHLIKKEADIKNKCIFLS